MRNGVLWAVLALILVSVNALVLDKEAILSDGELMLLRLAPRDRYGELRVDKAGNAVLTGLRGEGRERLGLGRAGEYRQG